MIRSNNKQPSSRPGVTLEISVLPSCPCSQPAFLLLLLASQTLEQHQLMSDQLTICVVVVHRIGQRRQQRDPLLVTVAPFSAPPKPSVSLNSFAISVLLMQALPKESCVAKGNDQSSVASGENKFKIDTQARSQNGFICALFAFCRLNDRHRILFRLHINAVHFD